MLLSGIQHYYFCRKQWQLIHINQEWLDNQATKEGDIIHEKADNPQIKESRNNIFYVRAMSVSSKRLGLSGVLDVVEFKKDENGISVLNKKGKWIPEIIEYKRGKPKKDDRDIVQLTAQVICLEETLNITIKTGSFYYDSIKQRQKIDITSRMRDLVSLLAKQMHNDYSVGKVISIPELEKCKQCSLYDICLPKLVEKSSDVKKYIRNKVMGDDIL